MNPQGGNATVERSYGSGQHWRGNPNTGSLASGRNHAAQADGAWNDAELTGIDAELDRGRVRLSPATFRTYLDGTVSQGYGQVTRRGINTSVRLSTSGATIRPHGEGTI